MYELKPLTREGIGPALAKVERYRLLNEPWEAESICRDILAVDPEHQEALIALILSLTDQLPEMTGKRLGEARALLPRLNDPYHRAYYAGIICERKGTTTLKRNAPGCGPVVHRWLTDAMVHYEKAESLRPSGNDDAILRWNTCARIIMQNEQVAAAPHAEAPVLLE